GSPARATGPDAGPGRVAVAAPEDAAERWPDERWPADSGADPWTAHVAAETGNGRNGFHGFRDPGGAEAWPPVIDPGPAESPGYRELDDGDEDLADSDSLPRRVRQASLAPQLRENTLHG